MAGHSPLALIVALLASAALTLFLAHQAWQRKRTELSAPFVGLMLASMLYAFGYAFELASRALPDMMFWIKIEYIGIAALPLFWIFLTARYTRKDHWLSPPVTAALIGLAALTLLLNWTNDWHHLFYRSVSVDVAGRYPLLALHKGPWYWVHQAYVAAAAIIGLALLAGRALRSSPTFRRQSLVMLTGSLLPWSFDLVYQAGGGPRSLDLAPFGLALAGPVFLWGVLRFQLLEINPVAHESILEGIDDGILVLDSRGRILDLNEAVAKIFPDLGRRHVGRFAAERLPEQAAVLSQMCTGGLRETELTVGAADRVRHLRAHASPVTGNRGKIVARTIIFRDITEQAELLRRLQKLATVDDLTGAWNRRHFIELSVLEIGRAKRYGHPLSLAFVDLDNFKRINDTWGHEVGDKVLRAVSEVMRAAIRTTDVLGRWGGEEFAILMPETEPEAARIVADRVRDRLSRTEVQPSGHERIVVTASFGLTGLAAVGGETIDDFLRAADQALYRAKESGRDAVRLLPAGRPGTGFLP